MDSKHLKSGFPNSKLQKEGSINNHGVVTFLSHSFKERN